jgi:hypothetical protein
MINKQGNTTYVGVIIFGSVRFLPIKNNQTEKKKKDPKLNRNRPKPTGFGSVFDAQNRKNLYAFFLGFVMGFMMGF